MSMNLSAETLSAFKKLYEVDQSLKIDCEAVAEGGGTILRSKSENNTMMARMTVPDEFPRNVHIYDLREFISVINIVNDPKLDFDDSRFVLIESEQGDQQLRYLETNAKMITSFIDKDLELKSSDVELVVTEKQLKSVLTAAQTMRLAYVGFIGDGENVRFTAFNKNDGDESETNKFSVNVGKTDLTFRMFYKLEVHNLNVLQSEGDLAFTLDGKKKISNVVTESGKTFWIAFDSNSEIEG
jgi:hypothetical protein